MKSLRVLSLFDGISCGRIALERAGIPVEIYYASEIDKYAIQITQKSYPDTIQLGDVEKIDFTQFEGKIDLLIGGSPCTNLSIAGNRKGLKGDESRLFWEYVRAIKECKPKYFLLENVESMNDSDKEIISKELGCYPCMINSALLSAQNRKRYYWFNWGHKQIDLFGFPTCDIPQPEDKGILLKDILESGISYQAKSDCLTTRYASATFPRDYFRNQKTQIAEPVGCALRTRGAKGSGERGKKLEVRKDNKANALTSSETDSMVLNSSGQGQKIYSVKNKILLGEDYKIDLPDGDYIIRKLTPTECEKLQTLPSGYTEYGINGKISNAQRYKCIGNGWTCDVIAHLFSFLKEEIESEGKMYEEFYPIDAKITVKGRLSNDVMNNFRDKRFNLLLKDVVFTSIVYSENPIDGIETTFECRNLFYGGEL